MTADATTKLRETLVSAKYLLIGFGGDPRGEEYGDAILSGVLNDIDEAIASLLVTTPARREAVANAAQLIAAEDARQTKLHGLLETIREQIRLEIPAEHRPDGLFKNIQDAVYAMRGRTALMDDAAITTILALYTAPQPPGCDEATQLRCAEDQLSRIEALIPNWKSYRDLQEAVELTLHDLRSRING